MRECTVWQRLLVVVAEVDYAICELDGEIGRSHSDGDERASVIMGFGDFLASLSLRDQNDGRQILVLGCRYDASCGPRTSVSVNDSRLFEIRKL